MELHSAPEHEEALHTNLEVVVHDNRRFCRLAHHGRSSLSPEMGVCAQALENSGKPTSGLVPYCHAPAAHQHLKKHLQDREFSWR
jgi:hypothetical protein